MDGGEITKIVHHKRTQVVKVLSDGEQWMRVDWRCPVVIGDHLSWDNGVGYLSSADGLYRRDSIGPCRATDAPGRHWTGNCWVTIDEKD